MNRHLSHSLILVAIIILANAGSSCNESKRAAVAMPVWTISFPERYVYRMEDKLVSLNGLLFCLAADTFPGRKAKLYAINGASGSIAWEKEVQMAELSSIYGRYPFVVAADGIVCYKADSRALIALDAHTGDERWRCANFSSLLDVFQGEIHIFDGHGQYVILDSKDGRIRATTEIKDDQYTRLLLTDDRRFLFNNGELTVTDLRGRSVLWSYKPDDRIGLKMTAGEGVFYLIDHASIIAFEESKGQVLWQRQHHGAPPVVENQVAYIGRDSSRGSRVVKLNPRTGEEIGSVAAELWSHLEPVVGEGVLYSLSFTSHYSQPGAANILHDANRAGSADYSLTSKSAADGKLLWSTQTLWGEYVTRPLVANGFVYFAISNADWRSGRLLAYRVVLPDTQ